MDTLTVLWSKVREPVLVVLLAASLLCAVLARWPLAIYLLLLFAVFK